MIVPVKTRVTKQKRKPPTLLFFSCPEEGCIKCYQRYLNLQQHLDSRKHTRALEREPLLDQAVYGYAE